MQAGGVDASDVVLAELGSGTFLSPDVFSLAGGTLTLTFNSLPEGAYELTLLSGAGGFRDQVNNPLDGNGDGTGGMIL